MRQQSEPMALIGYEELKGLIRQEIEATQQHLEAKPVHDTISLDEAIKMLYEHGLPTSKAKIYKLTSACEIPHRKYGNKLVFSRKDLRLGMEEQVK
jgi:hypothetical protein